MLAVAGCNGSGGQPAGADQPAGAAPSGTVTVFAAASLTESFGALGKQVEAANPGLTVAFNFAGSSGLATQINQGAPADVFAAASPATMRTVMDAGNGSGDARTFARNELVIAVPEGNPRGITGLADLARPGTKVAICAEQVPCGAAARKALSAAAVDLTPVTLEQDVKAALSKLTLGEVDAALVYRTDAAASASTVDTVEFAESKQAVNDYPIVVLANAPNPAGAQAFVEYVLSAQGRAVLADTGFQVP
ncbi:MAG TPA: molybdate ABC transporter substrate-binding protein [Micromonosporaceae bacterium]|nr:molybdate ABC transporter substrate-binding protein [Micromonosporaceae bacterium]